MKNYKNISATKNTKKQKIISYSFVNYFFCYFVFFVAIKIFIYAEAA